MFYRFIDEAYFKTTDYTIDTAMNYIKDEEGVDV